MAAPTPQFLLLRDISGLNAYGLKQSIVTWGVLLAKDTEKSVTAPTDYANLVAVIKTTPGANVFINTSGDGTSAAAYTGTFSLVKSELDPGVRYVKGGDTISCITPDTNGAYVQISFYTLEAS